MSRWSVLGLVLMSAGCATSPQVEEPPPGHDGVVGQRMLAPDAGGGSGGTEEYTLSAREAFRMPQAHHAPPPEMPQALLQGTLAPTTVCLRVIVSAEGVVERTEPLLSRADCAAGERAGHAALLDAARDAVMQWQYRPAARCYFAPRITPQRPDDCTGAERIEPVPVTLQYAFTFEVVEGQARVRMPGEQVP